MAKDQTRTVDEIRAELARNRTGFAESVSDFVTEIQPKNIVKRGVADAKGFVSNEFNNAKQQIKDENGWRTDRLLVIGGAILGLVVFAATVNSISRRRSIDAQVRKALEA